MAALGNVFVPRYSAWLISDWEECDCGKRKGLRVDGEQYVATVTVVHNITGSLNLSYSPVDPMDGQ